MITLISETGDHKLSILDFDASRTNVRYKAVIDDDQLVVLHLQTVDTEDTPDVSQLSLCPGVLESEVLHLLSQSPVSNTLVCVMFLIEKLQTDIQVGGGCGQHLQQCGPYRCQGLFRGVATVYLMP